MSQKKIILIVGVNAAGKTTVLSNIRKMYGESNACFLTSSQLFFDMFNEGVHDYTIFSRISPEEMEQKRAKMFQYVRSLSMDKTVFLDTHIYLSDTEYIDFSKYFRDEISLVIYVQSPLEHIRDRRFKTRVKRGMGKLDLSLLDIDREIQTERFHCSHLLDDIYALTGRRPRYTDIYNNGDFVNLDREIRRCMLEYCASLEGSCMSRESRR